MPVTRLIQIGGSCSHRTILVEYSPWSGDWVRLEFTGSLPHTCGVLAGYRGRGALLPGRGAPTPAEFRTGTPTAQNPPVTESTGDAVARYITNTNHQNTVSYPSLPALDAASP